MLTYKPSPSLAGPLYGKEPWPLRFHTHTFDARCMNTLAASVIYDRFQFGNRKQGIFGEPVDSPSGPPQENWKESWRGRSSILPRGGRTFPGPVAIEWASMDGETHAVSVDLDEIFQDRLILHRVKRSEVKETWLEGASIQPVSPDILLELNDRSIRVYMRALVITEDEQSPGNPHSNRRNDLMLAWERAY